MLFHTFPSNSNEESHKVSEKGVGYSKKIVSLQGILL